MLHHPRGAPATLCSPTSRPPSTTASHFCRHMLFPLKGVFFLPTMPPSQAPPLTLLRVTAAANATEQAPEQGSAHLPPPPESSPGLTLWLCQVALPVPGPSSLGDEPCLGAPLGWFTESKDLSLQCPRSPAQGLLPVSSHILFGGARPGQHSTAQPGLVTASGRALIGGGALVGS